MGQWQYICFWSALVCPSQSSDIPGVVMSLASVCLHSFHQRSIKSGQPWRKWGLDPIRSFVGMHSIFLSRGLPIYLKTWISFHGKAVLPPFVVLENFFENRAMFEIRLVFVGQSCPKNPLLPVSCNPISSSASLGWKWDRLVSLQK